jgi:cell division protein ZapA
LTRIERVAQVNVSINGKQYRMACDDGQESHLSGLADRLNTAIEALRDRFGEIGDQRLTVMAAITFADHAAEASRRIADLERRLAESERTRSAVADRGGADLARAANAVLAVAERLESLAGRLAGVPPGRIDSA